MPLNGNGSYTPPAPEFPAVPGTLIQASDFNTVILDMSAALSQALYNDGQQIWTGDQDADGNGIVNVGSLAAGTGGATVTGQFNFSTSPTGPTPTIGDNTQKLATTEFVNSTAFATALPSQAGNATKVVKTNGTVASWAWATVPRVTRTSDTVIAAADGGQLFDITSGTFTQTFVAAATFGPGNSVFIRNSGTGDLTLGITLDGMANPIMYPGECRLILCDGTDFTSVVLTPFQKTFTTTGSFKVPPGYKEIGVMAIGGGGGGGSDSRSAAGTSRNGGAGGGGGAVNICILTALTAGTSYTATVAAGGAGAAAQTVNTTDGIAGSVGGTSSFGTLVLAYGGGGGAAAQIGNNVTGSGGGGTGGAGSASSGGAPKQTADMTSANTPLNAVGGGGGASTGNATNGGCAEYGGAGGGGTANTVDPHTGGSSIYGGGGGGAGGGITSANAVTAGAAAGVSGSYTAGGGAAGGAATGANGTDGAASTGLCGGGGGGGGASAAGIGGTGGAGGAPGGGGGGGAGSLNGNASGAGGVGGRGEIRVWGIA